MVYNFTLLLSVSFLELSFLKTWPMHHYELDDQVYVILNLHLTEVVHKNQQPFT